MGVSEGRSDSFCGNLGHFLGFDSLKVLSFDRYCLHVGPRAKLLDIESAYFAFVGSRDMRCGQMGSSRVRFCSF